ncbi:MAG: 50S ribosomal protein L3 [Candidatus Sumerlaeia bacterium]
MIGILGKKLGMTRIYDAAGTVIPVTVIQAGPCPVLQIKNVERDGYNALQLGFDPIPERKANKPMTGHFKRAGATPQRLVREVRIDSLDGFSLGQQLDLSLFAVGEKVDVIGVSKGRGFAGPMKRHHSSRGPETHGSMYHRRAGSVGASADPSRVLKGKHMAGHMGAEQVTAQNLVVVRMDPSNNLLVVRGSVPGHNNGYVMIRKKRSRAAAGK